MTQIDPAGISTRRQLAEQLAELFHQGGWSHHRLAEAAGGLSPATVYGIVNGTTKVPRAATLAAFVTACGQPPEPWLAARARVVRAEKNSAAPEPPIRPVTGNLPAEMTSFVGRRAELTELRRLLGESRLVTLTGMGGVGKTRLALRVADESRPSFADGVWLVELSALWGPELLTQLVAGTLRLPDQSVRSRLDVLVEHLAGKRLLLILDTCEHLVDACAMLVDELLRAAPGLRVLATSREPLGVRGEHIMVVPPLSGDAAALFVERAAAVVPDFSITAQDPRVLLLCEQLDGIPLAIELAAVRLRALSLDQLLERLHDRFRLLTGTRQLTSRHRTLLAAVGWSHELCTPAEQLLWARLAVFPGGFDLTAAEYVCGDEAALRGDEVFETLAALVEKSVVLREEDGRRYRMLDTIREYGTEREELEPIRRRHRDWYLRLALEAEAQSFGAHQAEWLARLRREHANLRTALAYCLCTPGESDNVQQLAAALTPFWFSAGLLGEGLHWLRRGFECGHPAQVKALCMAGLLAALQGDLEEAKAYQMKAAEGGNQVAMVDHLAGLIAFISGDLERARGHLEKPAPTNDLWMMLRLPLLAGVHVLLGDGQRALDYCDESCSASEVSGDRWGMAYTACVRGAVRLLTGDVGEAANEARLSLRLMRDLNDRIGCAMALDLAAGCAGFEDQGRSARLFGAADSLWRALGTRMFPGLGYLAVRDHSLSEVRASLGEEQWCAAHAEGAQLTQGEAIGLALGE